MRPGNIHSFSYIALFVVGAASFGIYANSFFVFLGVMAITATVVSAIPQPVEKDENSTNSDGPVK